MVNNNELFANILKNNPPEYNYGDKVYTKSGVSFVSGRVFKEREKIWKYTVKPYGINTHIDEVLILGKVS
jgi:hypothetical protein